MFKGHPKGLLAAALSNMGELFLHSNLLFTKIFVSLPPVTVN